MQKSETNIKTKRLLERLRSPLLHIASQLSPNKETPLPHRYVSPEVKQVATAVESLSSGRYSLARDQKHLEQELALCTRVKIYDHECGHYSWLTLGQMEALQVKLDKWCCYCNEPLSFEHIGDKTDVQRFVELRSGGKAYFSWRNAIEGNDLTDIFDFNCLASSHKGMHYSTPFTWFLRESRPSKSFSEFSAAQTCGCPCCTDELIQKTIKY